MTPGLQGWWEINEEYVDFLSVLSCLVSIYINSFNHAPGVQTGVICSQDS